MCTGIVRVHNVPVQLLITSQKDLTFADICLHKI
jgi:hypothetical protein